MESLICWGEGTKSPVKVEDFWRLKQRDWCEFTSLGYL